jgi:unsaturated rhamnogalacturonyl hydrolase
MHLESRLAGLWRRFVAPTLACLLPLGAAAQSLPSRSTILSTVSLVNDYWTSHNSATGLTNNWNGAVCIIGDLAAYDATGNSTYLNYAQSWANAYGYGIYGGNTNRKADCQAAGQAYIRLYQLAGDISKLNNITTNVHAMVAGSASSDWTWCDALNMAMPTWAMLGQIDHDPAYASRMHDFYTYSKTAVGGPGLWDSTVHLWYRDATFISPPVFWSRGNAWVFMAHAKVLQTLPSSDPNYAEYLSVFKAMAAKLITLQQSDGFWYANLTDPSQYPTPETSGTSGFTYGLAWGIRAGVLDSATYLPVVTKAWNGLVATAVHSDGFLGYVQGVGSSPSSSQPVTSSSTADFGVGLFLQAGLEVARLVSGQVAAPTYSVRGGTYTGTQSVSLSSSTVGATIRYTVDGSTPTSSVGTLYTGPVAITANTTLKAIAYAAGLNDSFVTSDSYTIAVGAPVFTPAPGNYSGTQSVSITTATSGASIRYTTDGSTPTSSSGTLYAGPVSLSSSTVLSAIAYKGGMADSGVTTGTYTIGSGADFALTASPSSRTVSRGSTTTYSVSVTPFNGFSGPVGFKVSGLPSNASGSFSPISVTGSGTSTLTISTGRKTTTGMFTVTITGTSGSLVHTAKVTLVVQ